MASMGDERRVLDIIREVESAPTERQLCFNYSS